MLWGSTRWARVLALVAVAALGAAAAACGSGANAATDDPVVLQRAPVTSASTTTTQPPTTTAPPTTAPPITAPDTTVPPPTAAPAATAAPTTTRPHPPRTVYEQAWVPYAMAGPVMLHHPSDHVEAIGFHQSGHDGAQHQSAVVGAARWFVQEGRDRDTDPQGAADIVVEPDREVRVPVTGTVIRAGSYTLYCDKVDQYAVIEPDARPGWEVKVLHVEGLALIKGQRVEAGVTRLAARARVLPFPSTVEDDTATPPWPHVHIEVVDPSIPDRPTGPGCP